MTSSPLLRVATVVAVLPLAACQRGATVSSPSPATSPTAAGSATTATATTGLPADVTATTIEDGKTLFASSPCAKCHGAAGGGAQNGPNLTDATWVQSDGSYDGILKTIQTGVPKANIKGTYPFSMRPMGGGSFTEAQVRSLAAYVYSISHK